MKSILIFSLEERFYHSQLNIKVFVRCSHGPHKGWPG